MDQQETAADADLRDRTFILTDLKGSTDLHRQFGDAMLDAMDRHDAAIAEVVATHGGELFKNTGDGAWIAFDDADHAIAAAIDIQRAMPTIRLDDDTPLVLRIGVGTGASRPRRGDYFGPVINRTARLEGAANGGQIAVDEATRDRCTDHQFKDLGPHRFKGIDSFTVFQVLAEGLESDFGPLAGKREADVGNLPASLTSFIGRRALLDDIRTLTSANRIVTLTGPGGTGKSRLSVEAARLCAGAFDDGVWLVELSPLEPDHDVWTAFVATFSLPPAPGATPRQQVLERLRGARALLVIDNCEHVVGVVADAILEITGACPGIVVLASSRQILALPGEALVPVPPLNEHPEGDGRSAAVELFIERATLVTRRFEPTPDDEVLIDRICQALDHLPLAIEMAAANTRRVDLPGILSQAESPVDLRAARHRRAIGRQQTLRETLRWSYGLLNDGVGELLDRLSTFAGPFDEALALELCGRDGVDADDVLDGIDELLDASLLAQDPNDRGRFRLLHVVRAFGRERLVEAGMLERLHGHHAAAFADRVASLGRRFDDGDEAEAAAVLFAEQPDLEAAFERSLVDDLETAAALTAPLFFFTYVHRGSIFSHWPARVLAAAPQGELEHEAILCAMAGAHSLHADASPDDTERFIDRGRAIDPDGDASSGWIDNVAGQLAFWSRQLEPSIEHHRRAVEAAREAGNLNGAIISASLATFASGRASKRDLTVEMLGVAEELAGSSRSPTAIGYVNFTKGILLAGRRPDAALAELQIALDWAEISENPQGANRVARVMADIRADGAPPAEALEIRANSLVNFPAEGDAMHAWSTVQSLLPPLVALERFDQVALLTGALAHSPMQGDEDIEHLIVDVRDRLGADEFERLTAEGRTFGLAGTRRHVAEQFAST